MTIRVRTWGYALRCCAALLVLALLPAGCGTREPGSDVQHQAGTLFRSGELYSFGGRDANVEASQQAARYMLNGVVFYLVGNKQRQLKRGGISIASSWNYVPDPGASSIPVAPAGVISLKQDNATLTIELGDNPPDTGLLMTGSFSAAQVNAAAQSAFRRMEPASFPGMSTTAQFLLGRAQPITIDWHILGTYGEQAVDITASQKLVCESYDYALRGQ